MTEPEDMSFASIASLNYLHPDSCRSFHRLDAAAFCPGSISSRDEHRDFVGKQSVVGQHAGPTPVSPVAAPTRLRVSQHLAQHRSHESRGTSAGGLSTAAAARAAAVLCPPVHHLGGNLQEI